MCVFTLQICWPGLRWVACITRHHFWHWRHFWTDTEKNNDFFFTGLWPKPSDLMFSALSSSLSRQNCLNPDVAFHIHKYTECHLPGCGDLVAADARCHQRNADAQSGVSHFHCLYPSVLPCWFFLWEGYTSLQLAHQGRDFRCPSHHPVLPRGGNWGWVVSRGSDGSGHG